MTYYEILGIEENANQEQIKSAYRTLVKKYHPDVNDAPNAAAFFRLVQEAYETLSNSEKRNEYDHPDQYPVVDNNDDDNETVAISLTYPEYVQLKFARHSPPIKTLLIFLRILMFPIIPIFSLFNWLFEASVKISIVISWIISILGLVGIGFAISDIINHRSSGWIMVVMSILIAALGHYFPIFITWLLAQVTFLYCRFKQYAYQLKFILKRTKR